MTNMNIIEPAFDITNATVLVNHKPDNMRRDAGLHDYSTGRSVNVLLDGEVYRRAVRRRFGWNEGGKVVVVFDYVTVRGKNYKIGWTSVKCGDLMSGSAFPRK